MVRTFGPDATTSAHTRRFFISAVAGMRMPPLLLRSPSAVSFTRMRSFSILMGSFSPSPCLAIEPTIRSRCVGDDSGRDLHLPADGPASAAAVVLHPHPSMGGDRHHPLVVSLAEALAAAGVAALRVDLHDPDFTLAADSLTKIAGDLRAEMGVERLLLVGYSWGSVVTART